MNEQSPAELPWDEEALEVLEQNAPSDVRDQLRAETGASRITG